jgi:hypothetical protein
VPATLEAIFDLTAISTRDAQANNVSKLVTLSSPRSAPETLPSPVSEGAQCPFPNPSAPVMAALAPHTTGLIARPLESPNEGNLPGFLNIAQRVDLELSPPQLHAAVTAKHRLSLSTRTNAAAYLEEVRMKAPVQPKQHECYGVLAALTALPAQAAPPPQALVIEGYSVQVWRDGGTDYRAISDIDPAELSKFRQLFEAAAT